MPEPLQHTQRQQLHDGVRLSSLSIAWTLISSGSTIAIGITQNSLVLVAFGLTGLLDAAGSIGLVLHFRHALTHGRISTAQEKLVFRIVTIGLVIVALFTGVEGVRRLIDHDEANSVIVGVFIAAISFLVLGALAKKKNRVGRAIPSSALVADSWLSATGALLALVTVVGATLSTVGLWWVDPVAACLVAIGALSAGVILHIKE